jgi:hypothetical protein
MEDTPLKEVNCATAYEKYVKPKFEKDPEYHSKFKEAAREMMRKRYSENAEERAKVKERTKLYYQKNAEKIKESRDQNKELAKQKRQDKKKEQNEKDRIAALLCQKLEDVAANQSSIVLLKESLEKLTIKKQERYSEKK